jgi:WD40 repeat protein
MNEGGSLALAEGWDGDNVSVVHRRRLPGVDSSGLKIPELKRSTDALRTRSMQTKLRWAKMIDGQHVLAHVDNQIVLWNLVSGETVYRIDHVDPRSEPAISGGRRYLAVPRMAGVDLYNLETGKALGRIKVDRQIPGVSFSPYGNSLAIVSSRRIRTWNLVDAALDADIRSREGLGRGSPTWIDHDMLVSSNGILVSQFRGVPIWKYDLTAAKVTRVGKRVAVLRKEPWSQLATLQLPHQAAQKVIQQIDASVVKLDPSQWRVPGRSHWDGGEWVDRTTKVARLPIQRR